MPPTAAASPATESASVTSQVTARAADLGGEGLDPVGAPGGAEHVEPGLGEHPGGGGADAAAGAGDHGGPRTGEGRTGGRLAHGRHCGGTLVGSCHRPPSPASPASWAACAGSAGRSSTTATARRPSIDGLHYGGLALLVIALLGIGAGLVSGLVALRVVVAICLVALAGRCCRSSTSSTPTASVDGILGGLMVVYCVVGILARRRGSADDDAARAAAARGARTPPDGDRPGTAGMSPAPAGLGSRGRPSPLERVQEVRVDGLQRLAMISLHTSPLDQPGTGDAGGMNVYVIELAKRLARRGVEVDIFTRATSSHARPGRRGLRRGHRPPHPRRPVRGADQERAARPALRLRPRGAAHRGGPAGRPLRRRAQPLLALRPGRGAGPRPLGRPAGALDAHDGQGQERRPRRRRHPRAAGPGDRRGAGGRGRRHAHRQHRPRGQAADRALRRRPGPGRGGPPRRRPRRLPAGAAGRGPRGARAARSTPTSCSSPAGSSRSRRPTCCSGRWPRCSSASRGDAPGPSSRSSAARPAPGLDKPQALADLAAELGIADVVRFVPPVSQAELARWYAAATLVAVPSYNESFGLVAVEAEATGTPVVAAAVGGLTTVVRDGHSGLLVAGPPHRRLGRRAAARADRRRAARASSRRAPASRPRCSRGRPPPRRRSTSTSAPARSLAAARDERARGRGCAPTSRPTTSSTTSRGPASSRSRCRARRSCRPRSGSTSAPTRSACTPSSAAAPTRTTSGVYAWLLQRNLRLYGVAFAVDRLGDIYLDGRLPLSVLDDDDELDRLLGTVLTTADESFNTILELGFASSIRKEWEWRKLRGESTANLEAFRGWLEADEATRRTLRRRRGRARTRPAPVAPARRGSGG